MADQNPNTWEQLYAAVRNEAQTNDDARIAIEKLHDASREGDSSTFQTKVRGFLQTYGEKYGFSPSADGENILKESLVWRDVNFPLEQSQQPQREAATPTTPGLKDFLPEEKGGGGGGVTSVREYAQEKLKTTQKQEILNEFKKLLDSTTDNALLAQKIDDFYRKHLSAAGILGRQYEIVREQTKKLYGGKEEFTRHEDDLTKEAQENIGRFKEVQQVQLVGPLRSQSDYDQRKLELDNMEELKRMTNNRAALRNRVEQVFDAEWDRRDRQGAAIDWFAKRLGGKKFFQTSYTEGYDAAAATTFSTTYAEEETEEQPITPGGAPAGGQRKKGGGITGDLAQRGLKQAGKKLGEEAGEQAAAATGRAAATGLAETAAEGGALEGLGAFLATPPGWIILAAVTIGFIAALIIILLLLFASGNVEIAPTSSTGIAQNAKIISDNLCKTTVLPGSTVSQRCDGSRGDLYDNINPGAAYPQPKASFPVFDKSLQNSQFGIQFTKPDGKKYWAYNRPFCAGNCLLPWNWRGWGRYWCTDLVMDSYAASGFTEIVDWSDPDRGSYTYGWGTGNTSVMIKFFARNSGYSFIPANQFDANKISSGSAIFFKWDNNPQFLGEHTGIVSKVHIDHPGFGYVDTLEANAWNRTGHYSFRNNNPGNYIVGFGIKTGK